MLQCPEVNRSNSLGLGELPDVEFVYGFYAVDATNRLLDFLQGDMGRDPLKKDKRGAFHCRRRVNVILS